LLLKACGVLETLVMQILDGDSGTELVLHSRLFGVDGCNNFTLSSVDLCVGSRLRWHFPFSSFGPCDGFGIQCLGAL
jgi:hypothetical protein